MIENGCAAGQPIESGRTTIMLVDFLDSVARKYGAASLRGAAILVALKRPIDDLIREAQALGPYHRGTRARWSHCFLLADIYKGAQTPILDCTIRDASNRIEWDIKLDDYLKMLAAPSGGIYEGIVADYNDSRVNPRGVKLISELTDKQRLAIVAAGNELRGQKYHYDLPGLFRELARLVTRVSLPAGNRLLFCSAFVQSAYRAALGDKGDFVPASVASTDVTPDDIWYSSNGRTEFDQDLPLDALATADTVAPNLKPAGLLPGMSAAANRLITLSDSATAGPIEMRTGLAPIAEIDRAIGLIRAQPQLYRAADMILALQTARAEILATVNQLPAGANPDSFVASAILSALDGKSPIIEPTVIPLDAIDGWVQYENLDIRWFRSFIDYLRTPRDPFPSHLDAKHHGMNPVIQVSENKLSIAIAGDWGTGNESSARIGASIAAQNPDITIHLGDVYYAGEMDEESRFVRDWPAGRNPNYGAFTLNSNHEMYSGGQGYFRIALSSPKFSAQQGLSYFALELDKWVIVGLDSAYNAPRKVWQLYETGQLNQVQIDWAHGLAVKARKDGKRIIALTHHQGRDISGETVPFYYDQVINAFAVDDTHRGPDYWYWGHVHGGFVYNELEVSTGVHLRGRCVGHGGVPYREFSSLDPDSLLWWEKEHAPPPESDRLLNGYALLTIDGSSLKEVFMDEFGHQRWPRTAT